MSRPTPRVTLVVGGASGIGRATSIQLSRRGDRVVVSDLDASNGEETLRLLSGAGHCAVHADITDRTSLVEEARLIADTYGRLDNIVVAAGIVTTTSITDGAGAELRRVFDVNLFGPFSVIETHLQLFDPKQADRSIVLLSSVAASVGGGLLGTSAYAASKAAVEGLTRGLARELAPHNIRVNAVAPGPVATPLLDSHPEVDQDDLGRRTLVGRIGRPDDIASAISYLTTSDAGFVTGQVLHVNGGAYFG